MRCGGPFVDSTTALNRHRPCAVSISFLQCGDRCRREPVCLTRPAVSARAGTSWQRQQLGDVQGAGFNPLVPSNSTVLSFGRPSRRVMTVRARRSRLTCASCQRARAAQPSHWSAVGPTAAARAERQVDSRVGRSGRIPARPALLWPCPHFPACTRVTGPARSFPPFHPSVVVRGLPGQPTVARTLRWGYRAFWPGPRPAQCCERELRLTLRSSVARRQTPHVCHKVWAWIRSPLFHRTPVRVDPRPVSTTTASSRFGPSVWVFRCRHVFIPSFASPRTPTAFVLGRSTTYCSGRDRCMRSQWHLTLAPRVSSSTLLLGQ